MKNGKKFTQQELDEQVMLKGMASDVSYIKGEVEKINTRLEKDYVTQDQFDPIRKIVYGLVSLILIAVVGALLAVVIR